MFPTLLKYGGLILTVVLAWFGLNADDRDKETRKLTRRGRLRITFILLAGLLSIMALYYDNDRQHREKQKAELATQKQLDALSKMLRQMDRSLNPLEDLKVYAEISLKGDTSLEPYWTRFNKFCTEVQRDYHPSKQIVDGTYKGIEVFHDQHEATCFYFSWKDWLFPNKQKDGAKLTNLFSGLNLHVNLYRHFDRAKFDMGTLRADLSLSFFFFPDPNDTKVTMNDVLYRTQSGEFNFHTVVHRPSFEAYKNFNIRSVPDLKECTVVAYFCETPLFDSPVRFSDARMKKFRIERLSLIYNGVTSDMIDSRQQGFERADGVYCYQGSLKNSMTY